MSSISRLVPALLMAAGLAACGGGVQNVETAKTAGYARQPHSILAMQMNGDPFPDIFKTILSQRMAICGVTLKFAPQVEGAPYNSWPEAEARLTFRQLGTAGGTLVKRQAGQSTARMIDKFVDMYRYEFSLFDATIGKTVWMGHGDFKTHDDLTDVHMVSSARETAAENWSDELIDLMQKDRLVGDCGRKTAPPPPATPVLAAETAQAPPPAEPPRSAQILPSSFTVDGVTYYSLPEAEDAVRRLALLAVAKVKPLGVSARPSLVIVVPTEARIAANAKVRPDRAEAQKEMSQTVSAAARQVILEAKADAIRKSGLFEHVSVIREDDVAETDFKGAAYKIWEGPFSWVLARKAGGKQPIDWPSRGVLRYADLTTLLGNLQSGLATLDKA